MEVNLDQLNPLDSLESILATRPQNVTVTGSGPNVARAISMARIIAIEGGYLSERCDLDLQTEWVPDDQAPVIKIQLRAFGSFDYARYRDGVTKTRCQAASS